MQRRDLLKGFGAVGATRLASGCDKLVLLGTVDGLAPITPNALFYEYWCCGLPNIDPATHETSIAHELTELARITTPFLQSLTPRTKEHTLECIGGSPRVQSISNAVWTGLPLIEILAELGVTVPASAVGLRLVGADAYDAGIPIADLEGGPIWLVWEMNGEPLTLNHGAPARLLVPGRYGVKNLKWLDEIAFVDTPHVSFWTTRGWDEAAVYQPNTYVTTPLEGTPFAAGERVRLMGPAFAGEDPVESVDVRIDGGPWQPAVLTYATGEAGIWTLWSFEWTAEEGSHTLQARCTTAAGRRSNPDPYGTDPWHGYDGSMQIVLEVK